MISIRVNGRQQERRAGEALALLIAELGLDERFLIVEWNGEPHAYAEVRERVLFDGDRVELVRPVAGG